MFSFRRLSFFVVFMVNNILALLFQSRFSNIEIYILKNMEELSIEGLVNKARVIGIVPYIVTHNKISKLI